MNGVVAAAADDDDGGDGVAGVDCGAFDGGGWDGRRRGSGRLHRDVMGHLEKIRERQRGYIRSVHELVRNSCSGGPGSYRSVHELARYSCSGGRGSLHGLILG